MKRVNNDSLGKGHQTELARYAVSPVDTQRKAVNVLSLFIPFSASARGSDRKPVLTFRYGWAKVIRNERANEQTE